MIVAIPATIVCLNLTKTDILDTSLMDITILRTMISLVATYLLLAFVILLGAWYPTLLASRIAPAETLNAE